MTLESRLGQTFESQVFEKKHDNLYDTSVYGEEVVVQTNENKNQQPKKTKVIVYKYSKKGKGNLFESIIVDDKSYFITYHDNILNLTENIKETNRILIPPSPEEYPYEPYQFKDRDELEYYLNQTKQETVDSLYLNIKNHVLKYNDQDQYKLNLLSADIFWTYFQDKFGTTHYLNIIGDNGSGKSTIGDTFEALAYRPVVMTDPNAANLYRILGTIESGQCIIVVDEADRLDHSSTIISILKTGYQSKGKVLRTNQTNYKNEFFRTYCFKIIIAERSMNYKDAKGVLDRTFVINTYRGLSKYDIKEIVNPQGNPQRQHLFDELIHLRKLLLVYRLVHFKDPIFDVNIGIEGRDKELSKPLIQLFYNKKTQKEIEDSLQQFLNDKKDRKETSIDAALAPLLTHLVNNIDTTITVKQLWAFLPDFISGIQDEKKPNEVYHTDDYGPIYRNTITNIICDRFGAKRRRTKDGSIIIFNPSKLARACKTFDVKTSIQTKLVGDETKSKEERNENDDEENNNSEDDEGNVSNVGSVSIINTSSTDSQSKEEISDHQITKNDHNIITKDTEFNNTSTKFATNINSDTANNLLKPTLPSCLHQTGNQYLLAEKSSVLSNIEQKEKENKYTEQLILDSIYKVGKTDTWKCKNCSWKGDKWFMQVHPCKGLLN